MDQTNAEDHGEKVERKQTGAKVDSRLLNRFRQHVQDTHGSIYGNMGAELDRAIRQYLDGREHDRIDRLESKLDALMDSEGVSSEQTNATADGVGVEAPQTPSEPDTDRARPKPEDSDTDSHTDDTGAWPFDWEPIREHVGHNRPGDLKGRYIATKIADVRDDPSTGVVATGWKGERGDVPDEDLTPNEPLKFVQKAWDYNDLDTAEKVEAKALKNLGAEPTPQNPILYAWGDALEEKREQAREDEKDAAAETLDRLDSADR